MFPISNISFHLYIFFFWSLLSSFNSHLPQKSSLLCLCIQLLDMSKKGVQNGVGGDCCSPSLGSHQPTSLGNSKQVAAFFLLPSPFLQPQEQWVGRLLVHDSLLGGIQGASLLFLCLPAVSTHLCPSINSSRKTLPLEEEHVCPVLV